MVTIEWKDDLAIGAASTDTAHRNLLELLGRAQEAFSHGNVRTAVRQLRQFLSEFSRHFEEEQAFLHRIGHLKAAGRSSEFRTSHAIFSINPLEADEVEVIGQLIDYAYAWLMDHIIRQDMPLKAAFAGQPGNAPRRHLRIHFDAIKVRWRLALLALVPLAAVAALVVVSLLESERSAASTRLMARMNYLNGQIGDTIHDLQHERGLATLFLHDRRLGRDQLEQQYQRTNETTARLKEAASRLQHDLPEGSARDRLVNALFAVDLIDEVRRDLLEGSFNAVETMDFYTTAIEDLAAVVPDVVRTVLPSDFAKLTFAQVYLQQAKERAGRERAAGVAILSGATPEISQVSVRDLAAQERALGAGFMALAPTDLAAAYGVADQVFEGSLSWMRDSLDNREIERLSANEWFDMTTRRIDALRSVETQVEARLDAEAEALERKSEERFLLMAAGTAVLVIITFAMVLGLGWSILAPLARLGESVRRLASGDRLVAIPGQSSRDELGAFARIVQQLKERLVHGDLLEARRLTANAERLRVVADNMPGVVFRVHQPDSGHPVIACASRKLRDVVGLSPADMLDAPVRSVIRKLVKPSDWTGLLLTLHRANHRPVNFEFQLRDAAGSGARWLRVVASPSPIEGGWVWDGVALDVTTLKLAEEERGRVADELARIRQSQVAAHLASGIGQEFSAALMPLQAHAESAAEALGEGSPAQQDVAAILANVRGLAQLANRLLATDATGTGRAFAETSWPEPRSDNVIQFRGPR